jgi:cysteine synthase
VEEILNSEDDAFDFITVSIGTGGTIAGIINAPILIKKF